MAKKKPDQNGTADQNGNGGTDHGHASALFVIGANAFPQNAGYNPTGTVGALAYWASTAIREQYLKNPGPLVHA